MEVAQVMAKLEADASGFIASLNQAEDKLNKLKSNIVNTGFTLPKVNTKDVLAGMEALSSAGARVFTALSWGASVAGGAMAILGRSAIKTGSAFESQMARVQAISGATTEEFARMTDKARSLGAALPITAREAAAAMEVLAQRGTAVGDILGQVEHIINLSISQQYGLAESADVVAAALLNFGLDTAKTAEVIDLFNNAADQSALSVSMIGSALSYVAPNANALGMSIYETVAAMEALSNAGFAGMRIGTGLTDVITSLNSTSGKAADTLKRLGVSTIDASGKMRPFRDIMMDLQKSGMTFTDSIALFGIEGAKYGSVLVKAAGQLKGFESDLHKTGSTAKNVAIQMGTFENKWKAFKSASEETENKIFDQVEGRAKGFADELTELSRVTGEWVGVTGVAGRSTDAFLRGIGVADGSVTSLKNQLNELTAVKVEDFFERTGAAVRVVVDGLSKLGSAVPWEFIANNLDTLVKAAFWSWALNKAAGIAGGILTIGTALSKLKAALAGVSTMAVGASAAVAGVGAPMIAGAVGLTMAISAAVKSAFALNNALKELDKAQVEDNKNADKARQLELVVDYLHGEKDALKELTPYYKEYAKEKKKVWDGDKEAMKRSKMSSQDELKIDMEKQAREQKTLIVHTFNLSAVRPQIAAKAEEITKELKSQFEGTLSAFGEGTAEFGAAQEAIFASAAEKADKFAEEMKEKFGVAGAVAVTAVMKEKIAGGDTLLAKVESRMKSAEAQNKAFAGSVSDLVEQYKYLNVSPDLIISGLEEMLKNTKKIDEATGKMNERYKVATDALNNIKNMKFDAVTREIEMLAKAADAGQLDPSAFKKRIEAFLPVFEAQLREKIAKDMPNSTAREREGAFRTQLAEVADSGKYGAEFSHLLYDSISKFSTMATTMTASFKDNGRLGTASNVDSAWGAVGVVAGGTANGLTKLESAAGSATAKLAALGGDSGKVKAPNVSTPGVVPLKAMSAVDQKQGTTALINMSTYASAVQAATAEARVMGKLFEKHGTQVAAQTEAIQGLNETLKKQGDRKIEGKSNATSEQSRIEINLHDFTVKKESDAKVIAQMIRKELQAMRINSFALNGT